MRVFQLLLLGMSLMATIAGCQANKAVAPRTWADKTAAPADEGAMPVTVSKQQRLQEAMEGLRYESGRGEIDRKVAGEVRDGGADADAMASFERGEELLAENRRVEAIEAFTLAVLIAPEVPALYEGLGRALKDKGLMEEAKAAFGSALDRDPDFLDARVQLAVATEMLGRQEEANRAWRDVLALAPDHVQAHTRLAIGLYYLHEFDAAWEHVHRVEGMSHEVPPQFRILLANRLSDPAE